MAMTMWTTILARLNQAADKPAASPLRFALYNLALSDGALDFTDQRVGKTYELTFDQLNLAMLSKPSFATNNIAVSPSDSMATGLNDSKVNAWKLDIAQVLMRNGAIHWTDAGTAPTARVGLRDVTLAASGVAACCQAGSAKSARCDGCY